MRTVVVSLKLLLFILFKKAETRNNTSLWTKNNSEIQFFKLLDAHEWANVANIVVHKRHLDVLLNLHASLFLLLFLAVARKSHQLLV